MRFISTAILAGAVLATTTCDAHDTWVQTNTSVVRVGDCVHVDLMLGNHGNHHRDFKLASKIDPAQAALEIIAPDGSRQDLKSQLDDVGLAPKEAFLTTRFVPTQTGCYLAVSASDRVVSHGRPIRSIRSAKAYFAAVDRLSEIPTTFPESTRVLGHPIELIPESNPVTTLGPHQPFAVRLMYKGKPLADNRVSFIPRGESLKGEFDAMYERKTDSAGRATFTPEKGNYYLIVSRVIADDEKSAEYEGTQYAATLVVHVPEIPYVSVK